MFLGFIIDLNGIKVDPIKVEAILGRSKPTIAIEVKSFLNAARYLIPFIPGFSKTAFPLYVLTGGEKGGRVVLNGEQKAS